MARGGRQSRPFPEDAAAFRRDLVRRIDLLRREIEAIRRRTGEIGGGARREYLEMLAAVAKQADRLERRLERAASGGGGAGWEVFRAGAQETWRDLRRHLERVALSFRERYPEPSDRGTRRRPRR